MASAPSTPSQEQGWALTKLLRLHNRMRNDLAVLERVSRALRDGDGAAAIEMLRGLSLNQPGWRLQAFCTQLCRFVHGHHATEDGVLFPLLLQFDDQDTALPGVIDELRADHRVLSRLLDEAEDACAALPGDPATGTAAVATVDRLSKHLRTHLDKEERQLALTLDKLSRLMSEDQLPDLPAEHTT